MPIYEYYCTACNGRFRHLAREIDAPAPSCPRCGAAQVERLISAANFVRGDSHHQHELKYEAARVDREDPGVMAQFIKESGRLEDASGLYGSRAYKELIARRIEGATDADLADLVEDLVTAAGQADVDSGEIQQIASALALSDKVENRMQAEGPPEDHHHTELTHESVEETSRQGRSRRSAADLGWV